MEIFSSKVYIKIYIKAMKPNAPSQGFLFLKNFFKKIESCLFTYVHGCFCLNVRMCVMHLLSS